MVRLVLASMVGATALAAQNHVVLPPTHDTVEGTGFTNLPFGRSVPVLAQMAWDRLLFPPGPIVVQALAFRLDGGTTTAGKQVDVEMRLSTMPGSVLAMQSGFAGNRGADEVIVFQRRVLDLPSWTQPQTPAPFHLRVGLDRSFAYDPAKGALLVEVRVHAQSTTSLVLDATWTCDSPTQAYGPSGCGSPRPLGVECATQQVLWGKNATLRVFDAPSAAPTLLLLGSIESGSWAGVPIPADLGPVGAPGCWLGIDVLHSRGAVADAVGSASYPFLIPSLPELQHQWLRFQGAAIAPAANALGVVTSRPAKVQVCGFEPVARVWATSLSATSGQREIGMAPVLELTVQ